MAISEVIKYEGDNSTFIWKHPIEDFNTSSQLIVHESQEALFFMNGQILDCFGPGRHTLATQNIPVIKKMMNIPSKGVSPFHCEVYFVNKTEQMAITWGTNSKVQYIEPTFKFPLSFGACGEMSLSVADSKKLLVNLVGTDKILTRDTLVSYFRSLLMTRIKTYLAKEIKTKAISIFEIDEHLETLSSDLKEKLQPDFLSYGVNLIRFFITTVLRPEEDPLYSKFKDLYFRQYADIADAELKQKVGIIEQQTKAQQMIIESEGIAKKRQQEGYTYQQERGFDVARDAAQNEGTVGNLSGLGIGLGMMAGVGAPISSAVKNSLNGVFETQPQVERMFCDNCGAPVSPDSQFCDNCGAKVIIGGDVCSNCGFVFKRAGKFCPKCGKKRGE